MQQAFEVSSWNQRENRVRNHLGYSNFVCTQAEGKTEQIEFER